MNDLQTLEEKVQGMLEGEKKRREVGIEFINKVTEIIETIASNIWSNNRIDEDYSIYVTTINKEGKKRNTNIYFRWENWEGVNDTEEIGFYLDVNNSGFWGKNVIGLRGADFWYSVQVIKDWIPQIVDAIDKREKSRQQILDLLK